MLYKYIYYKFVFIHWLFEWLVFVKSSQREKYTHTHTHTQIQESATDLFFYISAYRNSNQKFIMRDALKQNSYFHIGDLPKYKKILNLNLKIKCTVL